VSSTLELVVQELQSRIGQITSQYETQMAVLKAQISEALQQKDEEIEQLKNGKLHVESTKKEK
jgi:hypothetical protein